MPVYTYSIFPQSQKGNPAQVIATLTDVQGVKPSLIINRAITEGFLQNPGSYSIVICEDGRPITLHGPVPVVKGNLRIDDTAM